MKTSGLAVVLLFVTLLPALPGCARFADSYVASTGTRYAGTNAAAALRESGARDLGCDAGHVTVFSLQSRLYAHSARVGDIAHGAPTEVAEGCGKRAFYQLVCALAPVGSGATHVETDGNGGETSAVDEDFACRYVLRDRVELAPAEASGARASAP